MTELGRLGFSYEVGDVVGIRGQDSWLERANLLWDGDRALAVIFETREAWLWHEPAAETLARLMPVDVAGFAGLPPTHELERSLLERRFRRPVAITGLNGGSLASPEAVVALYRGVRGNLYALVGGESVHAWWADPVLPLDLQRY